MIDRMMAYARTTSKVIMFSIILACIPPCLTYGEDGSSVKSTEKVALSGDVGSDTALPDLFTGAMSYQIPIEVPPGRNGMDPGLALSYSSRKGNGWVGVGWDLEVGSIERSTRRGVDYAKEDYLLRRSGSTSELVKISAGEFRSKIESDFMRIQQQGDRSFVATNKAGVKFFFGEPGSPNSTIAGTPGTFKWALDRIVDTSGNEIRFNYQSFSDGQIYLDDIVYNGHQIKFYLEDRSDKPDMYTSNFLVKTSKRLKTIDVLANGARIRKYELVYDADPTLPDNQNSVKTGRSLLSTVTQFNKDGEALPPIKLSYSSGDNFETRPWATNPFLAADDLSDKREAVITGDFNGDGRSDVAHARNQWGGWRVSLSAPSGFEETNDWSTYPYWAVDQLFDPVLGVPMLANEQVINGDFNGDGITDVAHTRSGWDNWRVSLSAGQADPGFSTQEWKTKGATETFLAADNLSDRHEQVITGDFDADGKTDVAHTRSGWNNWRVSLSTGSAVAGFSTSPWYTNSFVAAENLSDGHERIITGDFNGDGKTDVAHTRSGWNNWRVSLSTGSAVTGFSTNPWNTGFLAAVDLSDGHERVITGDFNGDGKTDVAHTRSGWSIWRVSLSNGSGFVTQDWLTVYMDSLADGHTRIITGDFNGDGLSDIALTRSEWGSWQVSLSTGSEFITQDWPALFIDSLADGHTSIIAGDFNGDGLSDIALTRSEWGSWRVSGNTVLASPVPDMLVSIDNGTGGVSTIDYIPSTLLADNTLPFPVQIVKQITNNDGNNITSTTTFDYSGGYFHIGERDFRGFNHATVKGPVDSSGKQKITETWFHQGNETDVIPVDATAEQLKAWASFPTGYMKGKPYRVRITDGNGNTFSETETTYAPQKNTVNPPPWYYNPPAQVDTYICDGNVTGQCKGTSNAKYYWTEYRYDDEPGATEYGNLTYEKRHGDDADTNDDATIYRTYSPNATIVGLPTSETVFEGIGTTGTKVAETVYYYGENMTDCPTASIESPEKGHLTRIQRWLHYAGDPGSIGDPDSVIEERMAYDGYGNLVCRRDARNFTTTISYDSSNTFPVSVTSPPTALLPGGLVTTTTYYGVDGVPADTGLYGQVKSVTDPNGAVATKEYDLFGRPKAEIPADGPSISWAYNNFGSGVGSQHVRISTSDGLWTENYFDGLGRTYLSKTKGPESKTIETQTFYDARGAVSKTSLPYIGSETRRYVVTEYDPIGRVVKTGQESPAQYIRSLACYDKDETNKIDPNNHRRRELRDSGGRLTMVQEYTGTSSSCSSEGSTSLYATTTYRYDVLGNLLSVTDAKGNQTEMRYDSLGRKRYMSDPDMGVWRYTYDANGNLKTQTDARGQVITFDYDALNRLTTKYNDSELVLTNTYDEVVTGFFNKGRLTKMVYPSYNPAYPNNQTVYKYDNMGNVKSTTKTIDGTAYNLGFTYPNGRLGSITYPDNETVSYSYDAGSLKGVTGYISYSNFDALGRPGNASYGTGGASSLYTFDPVTKRLSSLSVVSPTQGLLINNSNYGYDNKGNITSITDGLNTPQGNNFTSESYTPVRAHAVGSTGSGRAFTYDNNGNISNDGQRIITYNHDNMPTSVAGVNFTYDGNSTRVKKSWPGITTVYIDKLYECTNGACAKFIFAGDARVAMKVGNEITYYHPDHQGSTLLLTDIYGNKITDIADDASGSKVNEIAYYPFGETRAGIVSTSVSHMYTSQELDGESGLYNYNARLYDPEMGRFMTPDTIVQNPADPQTLNRYSYARNNPELYTDPSGHIFGIDDILIGMAVGAVIGSVSAGAQTHWDVDAMLMGAGIGAVSGGTFAGVSGVVGGALGSQFAGAVAGGAAAGATASAMSGGDVLRGAALGALGGAVFGGINSYWGNSWDAWRVGTTTLAGGGLSSAAGGDFKTGALLAFGFSSAAYAYDSMVRYGADWNPGGDAVRKYQDTYPVEGANNIGTQGEPLDPDGLFNEGGRVSRVLNRVPGVPAVSGLHDVFQVTLDKWGGAWARNVLNVPGMIPAAGITYGALMTDMRAAILYDTMSSRHRTR